jgi:alpha-glucosidase (family GH31 glycosyl hydrolase)
MLDHMKLDACPTLPARLPCAAQLPSHLPRRGPSGLMRSGTLLLMLAGLAAGCGDNLAAPIPPDAPPAPPPPPLWTLDSGALKLRVTESPWRMTFFDATGNPILSEYDGNDPGPTGAIGLHLGPPREGTGEAALPQLAAGESGIPATRDTGWVRATELIEESFEGQVWVGKVATTDADTTIEVRARPEADGIIAISVTPSSTDEVTALGVAFEAQADERFTGFGERSNAVDQGGGVLEHYVGEGPYAAEDYDPVLEVLPPWGVRNRLDATYYPIPWLLSSRGYGVLLDNDALSYHRLGTDSPDAWSLEVEDVELRFRVFAGPTPAEALGRFSAAVGRQPSDYAPWFFGPWVQPDNDARIDALRAADTPTSVTSTYLHYLPCGDQQGREEEQVTRVAGLNAKGTAVHTYFNPMICADYQPAFDQAKEQNALIERGDGETYTYMYYTSTVFTVSQFDFTAPNGVTAYKALTDEALGHGYEGWMEDFGEYTPLDAFSSDGATGTTFHNRYPRDYHCGVFEATADAGKPLARFVRSGWTGSAACSPIVWGGDPTTDFGFDGLESAIYQALSMGTSGVGIWGSDIGGFFALQARALSDELLDRWIAFGGLSVVMRSQKDGIALPPKPRPQPWDTAHLPIWRRYAKLHTQLYPYLQAAAEEYYATGMPVMRHHILTHPGEAAAVARDDQYMFGPHLLVAPVYAAGVTERELYLPAGTWIDWWRSVSYVEADGSFDLGAAQVHAGGKPQTVPAPIAEIPLMVQAGAVLVMLAPDVFTLAEHGEDPSIIHLNDRDDELHVIAFPRGESSGQFFDSSSYVSTETADAWTLDFDEADGRTVRLQASLQTLENPFKPCAVTLDGEALAEADWSYDDETGVFEIEYLNRGGALRVSACPAVRTARSR